MLALAKARAKKKNTPKRGDIVLTFSQSSLISTHVAEGSGGTNSTT